MRFDAAFKLRSVKDKTAVPALIKALNDKKPDVRIETAAALVASLKHKDCNVRTASCEALGAIGDRSAVLGLMRVLKDKDPHVRKAAVDVLARLKDDSSIPALIKRLKDKTDFVRESAVAALRNLAAK